MKNRLRCLSVCCLLFAGIGTPAPADAQDQRRFKADLQTTSTLVPVPSGKCDDQPNQPPVIGLLRVAGAGDANVLGPVVVDQSHCVRADLTFFNGKFTLTNPFGEKIHGRYFGQLVPTLTATLPSGGPPSGHWLILGNVCLLDASIGEIKNDCAAGRYQPARGIANLTTGDATIFLDQVIRFGS